MLVREYLHESGVTKEELAEFLGHKTTASVTKKLEVEMPRRWARMLDEGSPAVSAVSTEETEPERAPINDEWEDVKGRDSDYDPTKPFDPGNDRKVIGPQAIKLSTVEGYITQIYSGAAFICSQRGDDIAADTITRYTPEFSDAWINYIQSDPRIMQWLEQLQIGTPLGNLIGIHAIAIGSYVFARVASREIARAFEAEQAAANNNGTADSTTSNLMG
jgi:hypothetical protein